MRSLLAVSLVLVTTLAACGDDGGHHTAPETAFDEVPALVTNQAHARIVFHAVGNANGFVCQLDSGAPTACISPFEADVADGTHTFQVSASFTNAVDATPAMHTWRVDTVVPETTIDSAPALVDNTITPELTFSGSDPGGGAITFECSLDGDPFQACTTPDTLTVVDGAHSFAVRAKDEAGNVDPTPAMHAWTVDTTAPDTTITAGPANGATTPVNVSFSFTSPEPGATFECSVDGAAFAACTTPRALTLTDGSHTFAVRAKDAASIVDPTPAMRTWNVDAVAPTVTITTKPTDPSNDTTPTFGFTSPDATATFECAIDTGAFASCVTGFTSAALADGSHTFRVRATDPVGNVGAPASYTWVIDTVGPVVTIATPTSPTNDTTPTIAFTVTGGGGTTTCQVDALAAVACAPPSFTTGALADGTHTIVIRATDPLGNAGMAMTMVTVDTTGPVITIAPPTTPTNDTTPTISFTVTGNTGSPTCQVDALAPVTCAAPSFTTSALADGTHTIVIRAVDALGNPGMAMTMVTVDTTGPVVTITTPVSPTNDSTPTISFTVTGGGGTTTCQVDAGAPVTCAPPSFTTATLADGSHTILIKATDALGNPGQASTTIVVDTTGPVVTIATPVSPTNDPTPTISFTVTGGAGGTVTCQVDALAPVTCAPPSFTPSTLADGAHTILIKATDALGNPGQASTMLTVDTTVPTVTISEAPPATWPVNYYDIKFASNDATATFECSLNGAAFAACTSPFTVTTIYNTASTFDVRAKDLAGNTSAPAAAGWTSVDGLMLHYPWEQGKTHNTSLLTQVPSYSPDSPSGVPFVGGWAGTAAASPPAHKYPDTIRALSSGNGEFYTSTVWVRPAPNASGVIWSNAATNGLTLRVSGTSLAVDVYAGGVVVGSIPGTLPTDKWTNIAIRTTGPGKGVELYLNGAFVGSVNVSNAYGFGPGQAQNLTVGGISNVDIDDLRFYNRALSGNEMCTIGVSGTFNVQGACVPLNPGFELDFEGGRIVNTGTINLMGFGPFSSTFTTSTFKLGSGLIIGDAANGFGLTSPASPAPVPGIASFAASAPGHTITFWFNSGNAANALFGPLLDMVRTNPLSAVKQGLLVSFPDTNTFHIDACNGLSAACATQTISLPNGTYNVMLAEKRANGNTTQIDVYFNGVKKFTLPVGGGDVFGNVSDTVQFARRTGQIVDEYEFWPRDLSNDPEIMCENGFDGEWDHVNSTCLLTSQ